MSNVVTYKQKQSLLERAKQYARNGALGAGALGAGAFLMPAHAVIDTNDVVQTIGGASVAVDAIGVAIIGVVVGMLVIALIVRMILRKGM